MRWNKTDLIWGLVYVGAGIIVVLTLFYILLNVSS